MTCCCVCDDHCTHPANLEGVRAPRSTCYACGLPVCLACSSRIVWETFGRRRVCASCREDRDRRAR